MISYLDNKEVNAYNSLHKPVDYGVELSLVLSYTP